MVQPDTAVVRTQESSKMRFEKFISLCSPIVGVDVQVDQVGRRPVLTHKLRLVESVLD